MYAKKKITEFDELADITKKSLKFSWKSLIYAVFIFEMDPNMPPDS